MTVKVQKFGVRATSMLLASTVLAAAPALAQVAPAAGAAPQAAAPAAAAAPAPVAPPAPPVVRVVKSLRVEGSQRIEQDTVLSYTKLRIGQNYTNETIDQAIRDLYASDLFADVAISGVETGDIVLRIRENPVINRIVFEGNKRLKQDKIDKEIKLKPRQIFTRSAVRADVGRLIELYRRQGRFAATIEPKMVALDQNRVDIIFEITEGPKSKVRQINIIGNDKFSDGELRAEMATKTASIRHLLSSSTSYDQDRLAYDQQKLRQFYLTQGYADFRVISAVAELTPDKKDFIITYVVEEGPRYKFGDLTVESDLRDFDGKKLAQSLPMKKGDWYNAKKIEDSVDQLNEAAGLFGYAFSDVQPDFQRDREHLTMSMSFHIAEAQRSYIERIDINGNTNTKDKVVRREMRLAEGDAFNSFQVKRSQDRINSLGYFQDKFEIKQTPGSAPDRVVLAANLEEKATGELQLSAGFSSLEKFILQASITQRNFRGMGQELRASANYSTYSKSVELGFTEPYLFDKNIALAGDLFRRDYNSFNYIGDERNTTYSQVSTGFQIRSGVPLTEFVTFSLRYGFSVDRVSLDEATFYSGGVCDPLKAGTYLCDSIGSRVTSSIGYSLIYDSLNSHQRPSAGMRASVSQDLAGLGGDVYYLRNQVAAAKYWSVGKGFIFSVEGEGGYILPLQSAIRAGEDAVRITDRFYLGEPQMRGFDIRGIGPRVQRIGFTTDANGNNVLITDKNQITDDPLGGHAFYRARIELEIPLGSGARELGLRPSVFMDVGALFGIKRPNTTVPVDSTCASNVSSQTAFVQVCSGGVPQVNVDGSPNLLPIISPVADGNGNPLFLISDSNDANYGLISYCSVGYCANLGDTPTGTSVNPIYTTSTAPFIERFVGNTPKPRLSIGFGVNWNSPFGPLRIDIAKALLHDKGDNTKLITFNVGTQF